MKNILSTLALFLFLSTSAFAADGNWSGVVIGVESANIVTGSRSGSSASASSVGSLFGVLPAVAGYLIGGLVQRDVTTEVKRILVHIDEDGIETSFDLSSGDESISVGSRVAVKRLYSGGFQVSLAD